ncbi:MAG TPA: exodeoxyribonuclease VII large subunit [Bryobacteraceae bacterium]|jgi:exodeoxyribonuclease VII large subunit|nr:exodeoxyribonuclease VII large subunit [Bryobacteraceae bacterium]
MTNSQLSLTFEPLAEPQRRIFNVSELNSAVQTLFERQFRAIYVQGEISGCRVAGSGHYYFALKDAQSQIKCALFKGSARYVRFKPQDGLAVLVRGSLEVYEARGEYQLIVESIEPQGAGALQIAFEQLKRKLALEGLFALERKRTLPKLPLRIGLVTSPGGAVIRDMLHVMERRFCGLHIRLFPAQVQGEGAVEQVCRGIEWFSAGGWAQVLIIARGGGSIEDLWTFNEEAVARAIAASAVPTISAIGHETDFTIADFVADQRAPTPSAAAEIAVPTTDSVRDQIDGCQAKAVQGIRYRLLSAQRDLHRLGTDRASALVHRAVSKRAQRVDDLDLQLRALQQRLFSERRKRLAELAQRLQSTDLRLRFAKIGQAQEALDGRLVKAMEAKLWQLRRRNETAEAHLEHLSPLTVLSRGYAIVERANGQVIRSAADTAPNEALRVRLGEGELGVRVEETRRAG